MGKQKQLTFIDGYTPLELLVVLVVLGLLLFHYWPTIVSWWPNHHANAVNTLAKDLHYRAYDVYARCSMQYDCNVSNPSQQIHMNGKHYRLNYGWPDAGDSLNEPGVHNLVDASDFSVRAIGTSITQFSPKLAKDQSNCQVSYRDAWHSREIEPKFAIYINTSGCE